jgi:hypothetical protein
MLSIPDAIMEAARTDGLGPVRTLISVVTPMSMPSIAAFSMLSIFTHWNDYLWPGGPQPGDDDPAADPGDLPERRPRFRLPGACGGGGNSHRPGRHLVPAGPAALCPWHGRPGSSRIARPTIAPPHPDAPSHPKEETTRTNILATASVLSIAALALTGCGAAASSAPERQAAAASAIDKCSPAGTTIRLLYGTQGIPAVDLAKKVMEQKYPGLTIDAVPAQTSNYTEVTSRLWRTPPSANARI